MARSTPARIPGATYRLQLHRGFTFADASSIVDYLAMLGISDVYVSPIFRARGGSVHGYDVVDHGSVAPELGGEEGFLELARALRDRGMGLILDLVPNHMCVATPENRWWGDLLENGPSSSYAAFFDVDWHPPKEDLADKILIPFLGDQYGRVLENGGIRLVYESGTFLALCADQRLPVAAKSGRRILGPVRDAVRGILGESHDQVLELESILTALEHLPARSETDPLRLQERRRENEIIKRRLAVLVEASEEIRAATAATLEGLNGRPGEPRSFDALEALLADQAYRLSYWRVASDEINYRRFFDVNELAALRVEEPPVFDALHALPFRLAAEGWVTGFRIDHVDGLLDPAAYLARLPGNVYVVVEKILTGRERLRRSWPVHGTTGYEFLNALNGVFVDPEGAAALESAYRRLTGEFETFATITYESRKLVMDVSLSSELTVLSRKLDRISEQHRYSRDFTLNSLQAALAEVIACFPVYRSYIQAGEGVDAEDRRHVRVAVARAKQRNPAVSESVFDFIASVLLLEHPEGLGEAEAASRVEFALRFQQLTSPVMAKGLEDTAIYRFRPFASLGEVGGGRIAGDPLDSFHADNEERLQAWPHTLSATSTHDTKQDEDVRARLDVLSEMAEAWDERVRRWMVWNRDKKTLLEETEAPDATDEYIFYQALVGAWPLEPMNAEDRARFIGRMEAYMTKAVREAKRYTSWISPNQAYEEAVTTFIRAALSPAGRFAGDVAAFLVEVARPGQLNSAAQVVLKVAAPGVPDFYQGTELPEMCLVDPDNRRPVDFSRRQAVLDMLRRDIARDAAATAEGLLHPLDGRLKMFVTHRALAFRAAHGELFRSGDYRRLAARGSRTAHVVAFARTQGDAAVIAAAARWFTRLPDPPVGGSTWKEQALPLGRAAPGDVYRDAFTDRVIRAERGPEGPELSLDTVFRHLPFALLERVG